MIREIAPLQFADIRLATGVRLSYAEQGDPNGPAIILLHGYSDSWFSFSRLLPLLSPDYHIYALNQRGHGNSDRPAEGYTMADFAADVVAFMDALDLPSATLVAHSMGTLVAQETALVAPERIDGLVLLGAAANARNIVGASELQEILETFEDPVPSAFAYEFQVSNTYLPLPTDFLEQAVAESLKLPARVWQAVFQGLLAADYTPRLAQLQMPSLLLWGEQDAYFPRSEQAALASGMGQATLKIYQETGHSLQWERPEQVAQDLEAFLREVGRRL